VVVVAVAAGCGAVRHETSPGALSRYGLQVDLPAGWDGRIGRGAIHAANFPLPNESSRWLQSASTRLGGNDVLVLLFERDHGPGDSPPEPPAPELEGPLRIEPSDFSPAYEVVDDDHGHGRRLFSMSGRDFVLFVETGALSPAPDLLAETNRLLTSLRVEPGDFYRRTLEPARLPMRPGWDVGNSGARDARADGDWLTSWAATIPYADDWNVMHGKTLERLPRDGIVIWVGLERSNRFPPQRGGQEGSPEREPPFELDDFERQPGWEGQVRGLPQYVLRGTVRGEYRVDIHVYFGRPEPTAAMLAEAQAMLDGLQLPEWGPWELEP
jgi:hypothetical protein